MRSTLLVIWIPQRAGWSARPYTGAREMLHLQWTNGISEKLIVFECPRSMEIECPACCVWQWVREVRRGVFSYWLELFHQLTPRCPVTLSLNHAKAALPYQFTPSITPESSCWYGAPRPTKKWTSSQATSLISTASASASRRGQEVGLH